MLLIFLSLSHTKFYRKIGFWLGKSDVVFPVKTVLNSVTQLIVGEEKSNKLLQEQQSE
ncbi:hypothetical protein COXBURSA331_A2094 [Coxiella burnetii RSA 331]|nr:hypothetical protein COXBURSA331_A2094 [Coxiella burnetii RSA 331]